MSTTQQIAAVVGMNTRAMRSRVAASLVIVVGMAAVVAVALSIFSMSAGLRQMASRGASPDRMVIFSQGAIDGGPSNIPRDSLPIIADTPGIMKGPDGKPVVAGEVGANYLTRKKENGVDVYVILRGTNSNILTMRPDIKLIAGRMFTPGLREVIAGTGAVARFENVALGNQIILADGPWTIVGIISSSSSFADYALMADTNTLMASLRRGTYNDVFARLDPGTQAAQEQFKAALKSNPALSVDVETEADNINRNLKNPTRFYAFLAYGVGAIMGLGVIFAALNTMYAAVSARIIEIATLRAIGFGATPVVISIVVEALALATLGAIIGALIAWVGFNGRDQNYGPIAISLAVTATMVAAGIGAALIVGAIGALFPAIRAARLPVATALQVR
jgi:putative ABC transport system permease protein